ncbi:MAG TPA: electron transfer flavoprotein subunit alpha/FixB family protein [Syntrophorhabdaceae bacterium]|nr:electron transfer flavoprotein subunit alpha/FixB family protein [Syntrophorhabdaceae bacterium]
MADCKDVVIYGETRDGKISAITKELLGGARKLADDLGEALIVMFIGGGITEAAREAMSLGADRVYVVDHPELAFYRTELYMSAASTIIEKQNPRFLIFGHTDVGADLGPRLAFNLNTTIATDCIELSVEPDTKSLLRTKPVYGGLALATYTSEGFPQMATVRSKSLTPAEHMERNGEFISVDWNYDSSASRISVLEKVVEAVSGVKLEDAEVIVSGGRGIGDSEGFKQLEEAARFLKGALGASRVACDNGWVPTTIQVGITGKIVAPRLYLAVGISGASQHMSGCSRSKTIIAINRDPAAAIFKQAQFGVVGDWKVVLPIFIEKLKSLE